VCNFVLRDIGAGVFNMGDEMNDWTPEAASENAAMVILATVVTDQERDEFLAWYKPEQWLGIHRAVAAFISTKYAARAPQSGWEQDAKRYRWIRDTCNGCPADAEFWPAIALYELKGQSDDDFTSHQNLDAAIDAAIAAAPSPITGDSNE